MKTLTYLAFILLFCGHAMAIYIPGKAIPSSPKNILKEAEKIGLSIKGNEDLQKAEIAKWKESRTEEHLESSSPDPLLLEESASGNLAGNLEKAKVMARYYLYMAFKNNWPRLQKSSLNEIAADVGDWDRFENIVLKRQLERVEFVKSKNKDFFVFSVPSWGTAMVKKDLSLVRWEIQTAHHSDGNHLEGGADKIIVPE